MDRYPSVFRVGVLAILLSGWPVFAHAQAVQLQFHDGLVTLTTQNASLRAILAEWARLGGTEVVNADRLSGAPVTLQLTNVPETQALDAILRGTAGYIAGLRQTSAPATASGSLLGRILIIPTAGTAVPMPPPRPAVVQPPFVIARPPIQPQPQPDPDDDPVSDVPPEDERPIRVNPGTPPGPRGPNQVAPEPFQSFPPPEDNSAEPSQITPAPANPFGIQSGSSRPGTISPVPQPQNPRPQQPDPEP